MSPASEADRKNLAAHCMGLHRSFDSFGEKQEGNCEGISEHSVFDLTVLREEDAIAARTAFRADVIEGLSKDVKSISSKYFYDDRGSELYAKITDLEEYYLTRTEQEIFENHAADFVKKHFLPASRDGPVNIVELGAGDGRKTKIILRALLNSDIDFEYIPVDISRKAMASLFLAIGEAFTDEPIKVHGVIGEYLEAIEHIVTSRPNQRTAVLFIGSSIGNFEFSDAISFLSAVNAKLLPRDFILLGCDLRKDWDTMRRAYSDSQGVTRDFNLNLITRMNRELGTTFNIDEFKHFASYNPRISAMESFLVPTVTQRVSVKVAKEDSKPLMKVTNDFTLDSSFSFEVKAYDGIYTECSFKYTVESVDELLESAGFKVDARYLDHREWFVDAVAHVPEKLS